MDKFPKPYETVRDALGLPRLKNPDGYIAGLGYAFALG